ncbi:uncharacterized protein BDW70DRAFT_171600 [Aspergillus foveolatus]|uniref:uncharacterized protein n=1 Tax=Aspergillus foveolatus TaxID=210207 RepID=UPI003CCD2A53
MRSLDNTPNHRQICWSVTDAIGRPVPAIDAKKRDRSSEAEAYRRLIPSMHQPGYNPKEETLSPHPVLTDKSFLVRMRYTHDALVKAVVNIVDRWWADTDANFPARLPLEKHVEEVLQICEINSRTPDNVIVLSAHKHRQIRQLIGPSSILRPAGDYDDWIDSLFGLFHTHLPIHILRGRDELQRQELVRLVELRTGMRPRFVNVNNLELKHDESSATGYSLYCRDQVAYEKIHQVVVTLFPDEFTLLSQDMLRQLATVAVNDLRVSLFVNDERFLGIILQEINSLVAEHNILTPGQGRALQQDIVPTLLPGSPELKYWVGRQIQGEVSKDDYILKAARQSRGRGHLLGADLSPEEWTRIMLDMQDPSVRSEVTSYVLQPFLRQVKFDIIGDEDNEVHGNLLVGCYYTINGRFLGLGPWRSSADRICNVYGRMGCLGLYSVTRAHVDG